MSHNPYDVLGVPLTAGLADIKKAYRNLSKSHHPDKGGNEEVFKSISEAYTILSKDETRKWFDNHGSMDDYKSQEEIAIRNLKLVLDKIIGEHGFMADHTDLIVRMREEINEASSQMEEDVERIEIEILKLDSIVGRLKNTEVLKAHMEKVIVATELRKQIILDMLPVQNLMLVLIEDASYTFETDDDMEWAGENNGKNRLDYASSGLGDRSDLDV